MKLRQFCFEMFFKMVDQETSSDHEAIKYKKSNVKNRAPYLKLFHLKSDMR